MKETVVGIIAAVLVLGACDGGQETAMDVVDEERYCDLTRMLDEAGEQEIDVDFESATPDEEAVRTEFSQFLADNEDQFNELERVAPPEIADDVSTLTEALRTVAETGDLSAFDEATEAEERITEFEQRVCGTEQQ